MNKLGKYSFGIGDRFGHQGTAQLKAILEAKDKKIDITPVWNKSYREHSIIKSKSSDTRKAADYAVKSLNWQGQYFVDADHINMSNVDLFIDSSDFFTIDVADFIGKSSDEQAVQESMNKHQRFLDNINIPKLSTPISLSEKELKNYISKYLYAAKEAGKIYRHILEKKGNNNFIAEISFDEVSKPQSPSELLIILALLSDEQIPFQTIAPRFSGRFNKGVDYVGDLSKFAIEFEDDLLIIDYAIKEFALPENLKLSIHSGSDKFSIYPIIGNLIKKHEKGIHVKTAGTTWLEEVIGLALAGNDSLQFVKQIYSEAFSRIDELCNPYAEVIDIDIEKLPHPGMVKKWNAEKFANTLRHIPDHTDYNSGFRQLIHVGYKIAAEHKDVYETYLKKYADIVGKQVSENIYNRHICRLFDL